MNPCQIVYRSAISSDVGDIVKYLDGSKQVYHTRKTVERMVCGGDNGRRPYTILLATYDTDIVGIAIVSSKSKTLSLLYVSPEYRGNGIGRTLYKMSSPKQILVKKEATPYFAMIEGDNE